MKSIFGQLNYFRAFSPNFEEAIKPIKALLGSSSNRVWMQVHTDHVRALARQLVGGVALGNPNFDKRFKVAAHLTGEAEVAVLMQPDEEV